MDRNFYKEDEEPEARAFEEIVVEVCHITPEIAKNWLDVNHKNRPLRSLGAQAYGEDIAGGNWVVTGDTIKFDWFGRLFDGQHRLTGVVESGKAMTSLVVWGVDPKARRYTDTGVSRQFRDVLTMEGVKHGGIIAPLARRVYQWDRGERKSFARAKVTHAQQEETLAQHEELTHCAEFVADLQVGGIRTSPSLMAFMYWILLHANPQEAQTFMIKYASGADLGGDDPIARLRYWVSDQRKRGRHFEAELIWRTACVWNAWMEGRTLSRILLPRGGIDNGSFPTLVKRRRVSRSK